MTEEPTQEQMERAMQMIDDHLDTCDSHICPGLLKELAQIHPSFGDLVELE
jgi:hypothetical protein